MSTTPTGPIGRTAPGVQGYRQFLAGKKRLLSAYDQAKDQAQGDIVKVFHGNVGEAAARRWVAGFLPRRFGVTSGYIVSQKAPETRPLPHYDVIIYDRLESPILWVKESPDTSDAGAARGIPVEFVRAVIEVKAAFNLKSVSDGLDHLALLDPLLAKQDVPSERFPSFLSSTFFRSLVFFELRDRDRKDFSALKELLRTVGEKAYFDTLILRGEGLEEDDAATAIPHRSTNVPPIKFGPSGRDLLCYHARSECEFKFGTYYSTILEFSPLVFGRYAFDVLANLKGTYDRGMMSSRHASVGPMEQE